LVSNVAWSLAIGRTADTDIVGRRLRPIRGRPAGGARALDDDSARIRAV